MPKRESELKAALMRELRAQLPGYVHLRHEDRFTSGHPDISITGCGRTTWLEAKHATPKFDSDGIQELTMLRLAAAGSAYYVIWHEKNSVKKTMIVHPKHLHDLMPETFCVGFDHKFIVEYVKKVHQCA